MNQRGQLRADQNSSDQKKTSVESTGGHTKQKQRQQQKNSTECEEEELVSDDVKSKPKEKGWKAEVTTHEKNTVEDITLADYMASYVAVVGANDAGRSSAIKLFIGAIKPEQGTCGA